MAAHGPAEMTTEQRAVPFTAEQKRKAVDREIAYRHRVFRRMVDTGKMTQRTMDEQIAIFEEIKADYAKAEASERLI